MEGGSVGHNFERDPARFGLIWFRGFRGEDLNVKVYDVRRRKLTWPLARRAKNRPIRNKNCLWRPCLLMDRDEMSNLYRGRFIDASYQVCSFGRGVSEEKIKM
jgi:hypothetical protein